MKCLTCQSEATTNASFCVDCGAPFYRICLQCGHRNIPTARYCAECGTGTIPNATARDAAPALHPSNLVQFARSGERKFMTILFADIVGSTRLIENMEPDEAASRLYAVLDDMREAVRRFDGTVNKMQGDGFMALFGAPIPQEDHAVRACCAALAMRDAVARLGPIEIRIGMHTGEAVVQTISNDLSPQYEAMGVAVHIAARMEQAAGSSGVILTSATLQASRGMINVESLGYRTLKGLSQQIELFALQSIRSIAASQQFLGGQRLSGFVGRSNELHRLNEALTMALDGASPVLGIAGEPGAGKSRLFFEYIMACRRMGLSTIEARATAHGQVTPLQPILELMRSFFSVSDRDSAEIVRAKINWRLASIGLAADAPLLINLLGAREPAEPPGAPIEHRHLLSAFERVAAAVGRFAPAVVLFEDLHWLDEASEPFLDAIVKGLARTNVLLMVNFRPGYRRPWMDRDFYEQVVLEPLDVIAIEALVLELLGSDESSAPIRAQIVDRAGGNPFFAEEMVRALVDQGAMEGIRGNYRRIGGAAVRSLPSTVRGVIGFRIDRLEKQQKLFLEGASVLGREFAVDAAAEVVGLEISAARAQVDRLLELEMLYAHTDRASGNLAFKHPLVQEVTYASLILDRRRSLHRRAAAALTRRFAVSANEHAALIAHHWHEGGEPMQAAANYMMSANWIGARDPAQATQTWERVRDIVTGIPASPPADYMRMMACGQIINLSWRESAAIERLQPVYDEAMTIAKQQRDVRSAALVTMAYGRAILATGSADDYVMHIEEAQKLLPEKSNTSAEAMLMAVQSHAVGQAGFLPRALVYNEAALRCVDQIELADRRMLGFDPKYWLWALRARYLLLTGDTAGTEQQLQKILNTTEDVDSVHRTVALGICIDAASLDQDAARAMDAAGQLSETDAAKNASPYLSVLSGYFYGVALLAAKDTTRSRQKLREALDLSRSSRAGLELESLILANLAEASCDEDMQQALLLAEEARGLAQRRSQRIAELFANSSVIRILAREANDVSRQSRLEFDRLIAITGASRLRQRVQGLA
jgi:class 3 adenylate cyclase